MPQNDNTDKVIAMNLQKYDSRTFISNLKKRLVTYMYNTDFFHDLLWLENLVR
jgi:hypothetical protein